MKTRTLVPIDFGCKGELAAYYTTRFFTRWQPATLVFDGEAFLREADATYRPATSKWPMPSPSCTQSFDSTNRKLGVPNDVTNIRQFYKCWYYLTGYHYTQGFPNASRNIVSHVHNRKGHIRQYSQPAVPYQHIDSLVSSNLQAEAYWTMRPRFEGNISLINALYELKDFRDVLKIVNPKNMGRLFRSLQNSLISKPVSSSTEIAASLHLLNAFAVQPLLADIKTAVAQAQKIVLEHQDTFNVKENKRYFTKVFDPVVNLTGASPNSSETLYNGYRTSRSFTAVLSYRQEYKPRKAYDAFVTYWGLNPFQIEAVWNALPFSFLADYLMSIGRSFHLMRRDPNIDFFPKDYTESILLETQNGSFIGPGVNNSLGILVCNTRELGYTYEGDNFSSAHPMHVTGFSSSYYQRRLTSPYFGPVLPRIKVPSTKQGLNMLALLRVLL